MSEHLPLHRLEPDAVLTPEEQAHLDECDRCRFEARLLRESDSVLLDEDLELPTLELSAPSSGAGTSAREPLELLPDLAARYRIDAPLGAGGMGEVFRAWDDVLQRPVALKRVHASLLSNHEALQRFIWEARIGARLQHPGIVPVHDLGRLGGDQIAFVMKEVEGVTLQAAITDPSWSDRRVIRALARVSEAIAYAHSHEVVHRDVKPLNIMLGSFGEVWVLDWGIARLRGDARTAASSPGVSAELTQAGAVAGTLAYMAPEQAAGESHRIGPPSDVFALGVILHQVLLKQRPDVAAREAIAHRAEHTPLRHQAPPELAGLCEDCLQRDPFARPTASDLARRLTDWLDGSQRRAKARELLSAVEDHVARAAQLRSRAQALREEASAVLTALPSWAGPEARQEGRRARWEARELDAEAERLEGAMVVAATAALSYDPDLDAAHALLATHYRAAHAEAEARGAPATALMGLLRIHDRGEHASYIDGRGKITLTSDPPARLQVRRLEPRDAWMARGPLLETHTPCLSLHIPQGKYIFELTAPNHQKVIVPATIGRDEAWESRRPGDTEPWTYQLPPKLPEGQVLVTAGWTQIGGDRACHTSLPSRRVWIDDFVALRDPITVGEYLTFLNHRAAEGRVEEAHAWAPRERPTHADAAGPLLLAWSEHEGFSLRPDAEGDLWNVRWPAFMIDWAGACAYAAWRGEQDGLAWRLPWELEWERAARGADGRPFPWGTADEATFAHVAGAREGRSLPGKVDVPRHDVSPFGVRHLAGNVSEWMLDAHAAEGPEIRADGRFVPPPIDRSARSRTVRGGNWAQPLSWGRAAFRSAWDSTDRRWVIGFRLVRDA